MKRETFKDKPEYKIAKSKIRKMFNALRKAGFQTPAPLCCQNCTWEQVEGSFYKVALYNKQSWASFRETGFMFVGYGWVTPDGSKDMEAAKEICNIANDLGIKTEWDGNPMRRIGLDFTP